ncbi:MAG: helix-turn-helix domain-containing protein [Sphingopyxis sp.]|nr:helix-turn-helix domain-containing protein [Sphingopyxis sp.]
MSQDLVKSAARALEILELFASERKRMNSAQLGVLLGYPKSSLSVLLKSLVAQGYLTNGNGDQDYFPTLKLARLGEWIPAALLGSDELLPMLAKLRDDTRETVTLTMAADMHMRCLFALIGTHPISLQVEEGVSFPLIGTAIGTMYLASQDDKTVAATLARWSRLHPGQSKATLAKIDADIAAARVSGVACAYDIVMPDTGAIAMPIRPNDGEDVLIVAVAGLNHRIHQKEAAIIAAMQKFVRGLRS